MHKRNLESDCVALLAYVWKHREEEQTYTGLASATGIPYETVRQMIQWFRKDPNHWALRNYGMKYGYVVRYLGKKPYPRRWHVKNVKRPSGVRFDVSLVLRGRTRRLAQFHAGKGDPFPAMMDACWFVVRADNRFSAVERKIVDVVYVGTTQDGDGKLFLEDVPEYHPARETEEIGLPEAFV